MSSQDLIEKLKSRLEEFEPSVDVSEVGYVVEVSDGILQVSGLSNVKALEMVEVVTNDSDGKTSKGVALNLDESKVGVIILGKTNNIAEGDTVKRLGLTLSVPVGDKFLGRVVDPLLVPIDGKGEIESKEMYPVEKIAPGVMEREPVSVSLQTGVKVIDSMIPIGRGQRELIIGDRQSGKTAIAIDTIINQKGKDVVCVYVAVGQKRSKVARIASVLEKHGAMEYTTIVLAGASDGPAYSWLAPYSGTALAEYFMDQKKDVLVVYDDLSKHAVSYREISLLLRRPPGREAYPGDVFYLHSRLLERACRRNEESGGGSITALPIIETQAGDVSAYVPTNVISITDGQIFLDTGILNKGIRPAVDLGLSVSRVGSAAQIKSIKKVSGTMKLEMAQFRELEAFAQFASDLDLETKKKLDRGLRIQELLKQGQYEPVSASLQVALMHAVNGGFLDDIEIKDVSRFEKEYGDFLCSSKSTLLEEIENDWSEDIKNELNKAIEEFKREFK